MGVAGSKSNAAGGSSGSSKAPRFADDFYGTNHQRLSRSLRRQFASGVKKVKIVIRGEAGTGKSTLWRMLRMWGQQMMMAKGSSGTATGNWLDLSGNYRVQNDAIGETPYMPTRQIQVANLGWRYQGTDDVIKVEIWDVVDRGIFLEGDAATSHRAQQYQVADAEALDVYQHANGVILLFNPTKPRTVEYAAQLLPKVPTHLPVLVLATFADRLFAREDESFLRRRFTALRSSGGGPDDGQDGISPGSLHFMMGSLTEPACPLNPSRGLLPAVVKFFELPFLHLQRQTLLAKLKSNSGQMEQARQEWEAFIGDDDDVGSERSSGDKSALSGRTRFLVEPPAARISTTNLIPSTASNLSTDTLTAASKRAWSEAATPSLGAWQQP